MDLDMDEDDASLLTRFASTKGASASFKKSSNLK